MRPALLLSLSLPLALLTTPLAARPWEDQTGRFTVQADLFAFSDSEVVLRRDDGELVRLQVKDLSARDQQYLASKEALEATSTGAVQTWMMKGGWMVVGRIVGYDQQEVVIQRRRGHIYVNNRRFQNLPEFYRDMMMRLVAHFEQTPIPDQAAFEEWVLALRGDPRRFVADGVVLEFENGDEYTVPFIFFLQEDLQLLQSGWDRWVESSKNQQQRRSEDLALQAQARAFHQDRQQRRQVAEMQLMMQAVDAGVTDLWEVILEPKPGVRSPPRFVVVPARVSEQAVQVALRQNPAFVLAAVRKLN